MALSYIIPEKIGVQSNCLGGFVYDYSGIGIKTSFSMAAVDFVSSSDLRDLKALVPISCDYSGQLQSKTDRNVSAERELHYDYFLDENAGQILDASKRTIAKDVTFAEAEIIATWTKGEDKKKTVSVRWLHFRAVIPRHQLV